MEYIFRDGVLKTIGEYHTELEDWQEIVREFPQEIITDRFLVINKIKTEEDAEGKCYDWYEIDKHYRMIDRTKSVTKAINQQGANLDYVAMMTGINLINGDDNNEQSQP